MGVENCKKVKLLGKSELEHQINFELSGQVAMVTFHPVTLDNMPSEKQFLILLEALDQFPELKIIFTKSNADAGGERD